MSFSIRLLRGGSWSVSTTIMGSASTKIANGTIGAMPIPWKIWHLKFLRICTLASPVPAAVPGWAGIPVDFTCPASRRSRSSNQSSTLLLLQQSKSSGWNSAIFRVTVRARVETNEAARSQSQSLAAVFLVGEPYDLGHKSQVLIHRPSLFIEPPDREFNRLTPFCSRRIDRGLQE